MIRLETTNGRTTVVATPLEAASWLVDGYGESADAQGVSGPTRDVNATYRLIAEMLGQS